MTESDMWLDSLKRCAQDMDRFTTDDVASYYMEHYADDAAPRKRLVGGAVVQAALLGMIEDSGEWTASARRGKLSKPVRVWLSNIHEGASGKPKGASA
jgi:hypothetical protein